ncbi:MAG: twin-arginine translocase subunit TatC [Okeania sp. SIO3I5]|uniref:twin-arginine translocase subunit TatC n=1 Tax=Okeania sp. SIO3I5 TaxID=2607805 RepID=UPI0013B5C331|nr:twin-arginine translocase subunit TatC [Okeania sp. SIO3I5]NEQ39068.1 twin-arginine translocase subunit TatC [Okeania sp. SIO3I5]
MTPPEINTPPEDSNNNNLTPTSLKEAEIKSDNDSKVGNIASPPLDDRQNLEENDYLDQVPDEVEMSIFDHLEELRMRIFYSLIAVVVAIISCFVVAKPIVKFLEIPAQGVKFLQLAPGEYFFVTIKVAGYSGLLLASPFILYQIVKFVLPGLTIRERRFLGPIFLGSTVLFGLGLLFAYFAIVPAALKFFIGYGSAVVEQAWSIEKYFEFVLLLMFSTALAFQVPILQLLLGIVGIVSSQQMFSGWRYVLLGSAVLGAVLTPSTDPLTQSLLGGAVVALYLGGSLIVRLIGK